jgi:hypothetical protein
MPNNIQDCLWWYRELKTITWRSKSLKVMSHHFQPCHKLVSLPVRKYLVSYLLCEMVALSYLYQDYSLLSSIKPTVGHPVSYIYRPNSGILP